MRARSKPNRQLVRRAIRLVRRKAWQALAFLTATVVLTSCGHWRGIANVPLPGGPAVAQVPTPIYVQMPNSLALNGNSRSPGGRRLRRHRSLDRPEELGRHLTVDLEKGVKLPKNATAKIGQTSLLGSQHVELGRTAQPVAAAAEKR